MSTRTASWLAWSLCVVGVALLALTVLLDYYYTPPLSYRVDWNEYAFFAYPYWPPVPNRGNGNVYAFFALPLLVYTTVGGFVASRRPKNLVGWLLCVIGLIFAAEGFGIAYADYALLARAGSWLPGGVYIASISQNLLMLPALALSVILLVLLFPDGRLPDGSWRVVPWLGAVGGVLWTLWFATGDKLLERYSLRNPLWVGGAIGDIFDGLGRLGAATLLVMFVAAVISMFVRLQNADATERQQIKWFAYAGVVLFTVSLGWPTLNWLSAWFWFPLGVADLAALPVAVGIAIFKYRLYDIDRIINRTLVYGLLTTILAVIYFGGVTVTQTLLRNLTSHERLPQLVVVASTLVIAALFNPLRQRIQSFIDRSFYRSKYDAAKTLEEFSMKLRDETDLDALSDDLVVVIRETMQPAHVSLWLPPDPALKDKKKRATIRESGHHH